MITEHLSVRPAKCIFIIYFPMCAIHYLFVFLCSLTQCDFITPRVCLPWTLPLDSLANLFCM